MNIEKEIRNCKDLIKFDKSMIIHAIAKSFKKYDNNEKLKDKDIFLLGLRYPEMLCNDNDDEWPMRFTVEMRSRSGVRIDEEN